MDLIKLTHVKTSHENKLAVNEAEFLVVSPVENNLAGRTVQRFDGVLGRTGKLESVQRSHGQALEDRLQVGLGGIHVQTVVGVPEHFDVLVQLFEVRFGVLLICVSQELHSVTRKIVPWSSLCACQQKIHLYILFDCHSHVKACVTSL